MECTIGPASSGLGDGLAGGSLLGSLRSSDSLWRARRLQADLGSQLKCFLRHIGAAGFRVKQAGVNKRG